MKRLSFVLATLVGARQRRGQPPTEAIHWSFAEVAASRSSSRLSG
jgi:hypothetical protein